MNQPVFSVVIPAYNNAEYLADAINSVLNQSYPHLELIVVNDASPDNAAQVIQSFTDPRLKYVEHEVNKGLSAARNTGILNATGDYIALLDGDDYFHPDKLRLHAEFLENHADIDVTYNARFELNHSSKTIRELWRPPLTVDLADLILGYPFAPSDMVVRRLCMLEVGLFDENYTYFGEDLDINCKLAIQGYRFASVDRALNYRRFHSRRMIKNLRFYKEDELRPLYKTFDDPRFPASLFALKNKALANRYMGWSIFAYLQNDTDLGQEYILKAVQLDPAFTAGTPSALMEALINSCTIDENVDHEILMRQVVSQLPDGLDWLADQLDWAISRGYLIRGTRAVMWDRVEDGKLHYAKACAHGAIIDNELLRQISAQIISYEAEFGTDAAHKVINNLVPLLESVGTRADVRTFLSSYWIDAAFRNYKAGKLAKVPRAVFHTIINDPSYLRNRGVIKIFFSSLLNWAS